MKTIRIAALAAVLSLGSAAPAQAERTTCAKSELKHDYSANWHMVRNAHGKRAPGRNIRKWGMSKRRPSTCKQLRRSLRILRRMRYQGSGYLSPARPYVPPAGTATLRATGAPLAAIRACESGGNYSINTGNGYYGAYQFDLQTWQSVGGSGLPSNASPAEQDKRAAILYAQRGAAPWPVCGR